MKVKLHTSCKRRSNLSSGNLLTTFLYSYHFTSSVLSNLLFNSIGGYAHMNKSFFCTAFAGLALLATFFPMAAANGYFVNISHIGGTTYLLYALALTGLALSITGIYRPLVMYLRLWISVAAVLGLIITGIAVTNGIGMLEFMSSINNSLSFMQEQQAAKVSPSIGLGAIMSIAGYFGLLAIQMVPARVAVKSVLASSEAL